MCSPLSAAPSLQGYSLLVAASLIIVIIITDTCF
jgi:hypothetical protein